jgi:hypothetical protein
MNLLQYVTLLLILAFQSLVHCNKVTANLIEANLETGSMFLSFSFSTGENIYSQKSGFKQAL